MYLTLIRHGQAAPAQIYQSDEKRRLTAHGHIQAEQAAHFVQQEIGVPDVFIVSPLLRAQETLNHLQQLFNNVPVLVCDYIKPEDDADVAIEWLSQLPYEDIIVVCHMNIVAYIEQKLLGNTFHSFELAEVRMYQHIVLACGLSTLKKRFVPNM